MRIESTDAGASFDPALAVGLAGRLAVNAMVDAAQGGESWRMRDGLGAASPGSPGDAQLLQGFAGSLTEARSQGSKALGTGQMTASALASSLLSSVGQARNQADQTLTRTVSTYDELARAERSQGVDTDQEMQALMVLETAYGANAKVIAAVDEMLQHLLRI